MTKKKRDLMIAVALVILFLFSFLKNVMKRGPVAHGGVSTVVEQPLADVQAALSSLELVRQNEKNLSAQEAFWEKDWGRDPFFALGSEASLGSGLVLSGIVWDAKTPIAMINEKVLRVGDVIEGYRITAITSSSVVVVAPSGKESEVKLFESFSAP
jgi:hypothetical protein